MGSTRPFGNIRKLTSGRYQARYWHLGKQVPADTTFATKADARAWLATMETDLLGGRHVDPSSGRERFGDFAARWLEARDLRPRTRDTYASQLAHILAEFESVELRKITPSMVRAWHGRLAKSDLHANTVAKVYRLFRTMMDTAVDDGLIRMNPVHIKGAAVERAVERPALDWDDVERIAEAIHPRFSALVWVGATSGLRFGELTGLTRRHVDLERANAAGRTGAHLRPRPGPDARPTEVGGRASHRHDPGECGPGPRRPHRGVRRGRPGRVRLHLGQGQPAPQPLLRSVLEAGPARCRPRRVDPLPRPPPPRRHVGRNRRRIAARDHGEDGPRLLRRIAPLPQGVGSPRRRDRRRHRASA